MQDSKDNTKNSNKWKSYLDKNYKNTGTGETIQDVKLLENNSNIEYNSLESESDFNVNDRRGMGRNKNDTRIMEIQENQYTKEGFKNFEERVKRQTTTNITNRESEITRNFKCKYNKDIKFFEGEINDIPAFASTEEKDTIYLNKTVFDDYDADELLHHEYLESKIMHNKEVSKLAKETINVIGNDTEISEQMNEFFKGKERTTNNKYAIAKDILCDMYTKYVTGKELSYKNVLNIDTNIIIDDTLNRINKIINKNKNSNESFFILPIDRCNNGGICNVNEKENKVK